MDIQKIEALLRIVAESGVSEIEVEEDGLKLTMAPFIVLQPPMLRRLLK